MLELLRHLTRRECRPFLGQLTLPCDCRRAVVGHDAHFAYNCPPLPLTLTLTCAVGHDAHFAHSYPPLPLTPTPTCAVGHDALCLQLPTSPCGPRVGSFPSGRLGDYLPGGHRTASDY